MSLTALNTTTTAASTATTASRLQTIGAAMQSLSRLAGGVGKFATARNNAQLARLQARAESDALLRDRRIRMARTRAIIGASGVQAAGTPLDLLAAEAGRATTDAARIRALGGARADILEQQGGFGLASGLVGAAEPLIELSDERRRDAESSGQNPRIET